MIEESFQCKNGRTITIYIDDEDDFKSIAQDESGREIGRFEFREIDEGLKLCWAYLDKIDKTWCRQGIGREMLQRVRDFSGFAIVASDHDGLRQDDGSYLTGDAPDFVERMRKEGIIIRNNQDEY